MTQTTLNWFKLPLSDLNHIKQLQAALIGFNQSKTALKNCFLLAQAGSSWLQLVPVCSICSKPDQTSFIGIQPVAASSNWSQVRKDVKIPTYKPHTNHKRSSTLAITSICDLSRSLCWRPLTDLGHISSVTYVCHPLWFVGGHRKVILTSPLTGTASNWFQ